MAWLLITTCLLVTSFVSADDLSHWNHADKDSIYSRSMNDINSHLDDVHREKRQAFTEAAVYHVTQCNYDNTQCCNDGASIEVSGINLQYSHATITAAKLVHRMVRFMPRHIFVKLTNKSNGIGLFSSSDLPLDVFEEFYSVMPTQCRTTCNNVYLDGDSTYDCSEWCTTSEYPSRPNYPQNLLWAYGNATRTYVVETNIVCDGFNTGQNYENFLMREFGLTLMTRVFDNDTLDDIKLAYENTSATSHWGDLVNSYDYFMKATQIWFDGITRDVGDMTCLHIFDNNQPKCNDLYEQRQNIKTLDRSMFDILNYVYNDNREYLNGDTSLCRW
ncbi:hypothetical protein ACF0H5_020828 [Mactra antiquata]